MGLPAALIFLLVALPEEVHWLPTPSGNLHPCVPRMVIVGLTPEGAGQLVHIDGEMELQASFLPSGVRVVDRCIPLGLLRVEIPKDDNLLRACRRLGVLEEVLFAEPEWIGQGGYIPDDTYFPDQWHHQKTETPAAWEITRGSEEVIVAVLDTGINFDHPEFQGRLLPGYNAIKPSENPTADHGHGIWVAGLLAANANNGFGVSGVDHRCWILTVKVLNEKNQGEPWHLIQGITFAVENGAHVISMSLVNYPESEGLKLALQHARESGVVLVACSGNRGAGYADLFWPGASPLCITVGATNAEDLLGSCTATGQALDVVAPGDNVVTVSLDSTVDGKETFSCCSSATPIVAGVASLLLAKDPSLSPEDVQNLLQFGADDLGDPGWDPNFGWGRVNARRSLQLLLKTRFNRGDVNIDGSVEISDGIGMIFYLFSAGAMSCEDAADLDDNGEIDVSDAIFLLTYLFTGGPQPLQPFPDCGIDPTLDKLVCEEFPICD